MRLVRTPVGARNWRGFTPGALAGWMEGIDYRNSEGQGLEDDRAYDGHEDDPPDVGPVDFDGPPAPVNGKSKNGEKTL